MHWESSCFWMVFFQENRFHDARKPVFSLPALPPPQCYHPGPPFLLGGQRVNFQRLPETKLKSLPSTLKTNNLHPSATSASQVKFKGSIKIWS